MPAPIDLQSEVAKQIAEYYYTSRIAIYDLADRYNITKSSARQIVLAYRPVYSARYAVGRPIGKFKFSHEQRKTIADHYVNSDASLADLAAHYQCSQTTVRSAVTEFYGPDFKRHRKEPTRPQKKRKKQELITYIIQRVQNGESIEDVAENVGLLPTTIRKYFRDRNEPSNYCAWCGEPLKFKQGGKYCSDPCRRALSRHRKGIKGFNKEIYDQTLSQQAGRCAICNEQTELFVDHNHATGEFRGLLCSTCNAGLGMFRDDIDLLLTAIAYIQQRP